MYLSVLVTDSISVQLYINHDSFSEKNERFIKVHSTRLNALLLMLSWHVWDRILLSKMKYCWQIFTLVVEIWNQTISDFHHRRHILSVNILSFTFTNMVTVFWSNRNTSLLEEIQSQRKTTIRMWHKSKRRIL